MVKEATARSLKVLVVDDNIDAAQSLAILIELCTHVSRVAHSGPEAIAVAREFQPNVVFLDIGLPGMSGYEVASTLRGDACFGQPAVVAMSGWQEDKARSHEVGLVAHLLKPFDPAKLQSILLELSATLVSANA
jgi:CheY-like chemotaxis protein